MDEEAFSIMMNLKDFKPLKKTNATERRKFKADDMPNIAGKEMKTLFYNGLGFYI
jgi:hypothetical protein